MFIVQDILKTKGDKIVSVSPDTPLKQALQHMKTANVGALLVLADGQPIGIFSERDLARELTAYDDFSLTTPVEKFMTAPVITVTPMTPIETCMAMMTDKRIRHLPVLDEDRLVGIISIGDVVKGLLTSKDSTIRQLEEYITGSGYGQ
ncbi:MAG: CBS domain-containing protein [Anaerolineales bacterium]